MPWLALTLAPDPRAPMIISDGQTLSRDGAALASERMTPTAASASSKSGPQRMGGMRHIRRIQARRVAACKRQIAKREGDVRRCWPEPPPALRTSPDDARGHAGRFECV